LDVKDLVGKAGIVRTKKKKTLSEKRKFAQR